MTPYVLMVDDNPGDLQMIEEAFKDCRIDVTFHSASNAALALAALEDAVLHGRALPDVIILDLNLPGMSGRQVIVKLKENPALTTIPVVVFSGEAALGDAAGLHVDDVVQKPGTYRAYLALAQRLRRYWPSSSRARTRTMAAFPAK